MLKFPVIYSSGRLKVGILLLNSIQPDWVVKILAQITTLSFIEPIFILPREDIGFGENDINPPKTGQPFLGLFSRMDRFLHRRKIGPGRPILVDPGSLSGQICKIPVERRNGLVSCSDNISMQALRGLSLDLLLYFEEFSLDDHFYEIAKYGCCSYASKFLEWCIPEKMLEFLFSLFRFGSKILKKDVYASTFSMKENWTTRNGSNAQYLFLILKMIIRKALNRLFDEFYRERWEIAFRFSLNSITNETSFQPDFHLKPPIKKIYGDPFPVKFEGRYFIFFEEMEVDEATHKLGGHISVVEIDREKGTLGRIQKVLQRDYHLSYPFIFFWEGRYYMIPETHQNRSVELYCCLSFPGEWEFCKTLLDEITAMDVTLFEKDGIWWMFAAIPWMVDNSTDGVAAPHQYAIHLYYADSPLGEWQAHPQNPIKMNRTSSRGAGKIFSHDGDLYRPAQDCTPRYGSAVVFNRIEKMTTSEYCEVENIKIIPPDHWRTLGIHTFNACEDLQAVDFIGYRNRFLP